LGQRQTPRAPREPNSARPAHQVADFALLLYRAWIANESSPEDAGRPAIVGVLKKPDRRSELPDKAPRRRRPPAKRRSVAANLRFVPGRTPLARSGPMRGYPRRDQTTQLNQRDAADD
jgi:hypothetical protein